MSSDGCKNKSPLWVRYKPLSLRHFAHLSPLTSTLPTSSSLLSTLLPPSPTKSLRPATPALENACHCQLRQCAPHTVREKPPDHHVSLQHHATALRSSYSALHTSICQKTSCKSPRWRLSEMKGNKVNPLPCETDTTTAPLHVRVSSIGFTYPVQRDSDTLIVFLIPFSFLQRQTTARLKSTVLQLHCISEDTS
jgi:hypothetical protein